jgi:hypothetical protein
METFLEILFTALITLFAGVIFLKCRPKSRRRGKAGTMHPVKDKHIAEMTYFNYSAKFIFISLAIIFLFTGILYLAAEGYIILKW